MTGRTPIRPSSRNSASSRTAGGTRPASSSRCTRSTRCASPGSTSRAQLAGKTVLDVGCGGGILSEAMARRGADVTGIDLSEKPLKVAQLHLLESGLHVEYRGIVGRRPGERTPGGFDVVTCMELLEHVPDPASTVAACARAA